MKVLMVEHFLPAVCYTLEFVAGRCCTEEQITIFCRKGCAPATGRCAVEG